MVVFSLQTSSKPAEPHRWDCWPFTQKGKWISGVLWPHLAVGQFSDEACVLTCMEVANRMKKRRAAITEIAGRANDAWLSYWFIVRGWLEFSSVNVNARRWSRLQVNGGFSSSSSSSSFFSFSLYSLPFCWRRPRGNLDLT
ncbi:hypothetical protein CUMW_075710 [Citrus unshiu]|nr:hypothetical protein CUMW_075710 [Citrus unshiu]